jgi:hypothetical protein
VGQKEGEEMTKDEIEKLAVEAGWPLVTIQMLAGTEDEKRLKRFAELVAAAEREACAKVCVDKAMHCETKAQEAIEAGEHDEVSAIRSTAWQISVCAAAIRARGNA